MNRFLPASTLALFVLANSVHAQDARPPARDQNPPAAIASGIRELRDLAYVPNGHERQRLDLFLPAKSESSRPVIVWIHGGAWRGGSKENCPAKSLVAQGYIVVSLGYRLSQHAIWPAQIQDCKAAIRWLRAHASEYAIDPNRIGVWGASAGGHLAAFLGTTANDRQFDVGENLDQSSKVQCVIDWFGPTDFVHYENGHPEGKNDPNGPLAKLLGGLPADKPEAVRRSSPISYVGADAAPFLIMQGDKDDTVPAQQSEVLNAALQKAGVETKLEILPGAGHGGPAFSAPAMVQEMTTFLNRHLQQTAATGN